MQDHGSTGECTFDGKLGIFPFVRWVPSKRNSRNRRSSTLELKPITSVTKEAYRKMLIERLLPAIVQKWPSDDRKPIHISKITQDHISKLMILVGCKQFKHLTEILG